ncbi:THUMP domain-containing protein [Truncatella angustata]|uniref:THUMP domain-containing protein n=1 Tax=Truncatella angustata TaxID=152316 RepID=A0A9P8UKN7_9PEZI|nr:THUMP domain-containing protein [Truncatella angustata]KAH6653737.1 THUMP domain-containing protein [Truncatella angustata]
MGEAAKRKGGPGDGSQGRQLKKSKGGNQGKWQTPHQKAKIEAHKGKAGTLEVGDVGFWVSCQRTKEQKALIELAAICDEYGEKIYGIERQAVAEDSDDDDADIEASIQKEIESMNTVNKSRRADSAFAPMRVNIDCLLFVKTKPPVEPRELVRRICEEAQVITDRGQRKSRFINRFIPITLMGKATENGVEELAKTVLAEHFQLVGVDDKPQDEQNQGPSYAIRYSSRAHSTLKRDEVIKQIAALIGPRHKVNLTAPDKVVIIEIYQTFCGMSVVDGDFDALKRYNLNELYVAAMQANEKANELKEGDSRVKKDGPEVQKDESEAKEPSD